MNLSSTDELNATVVENKFFLEEDCSLIERYGRDVFAYLDVIRLIADNKMDIYKPDVHKKILLKSLFNQLYDSLCRHLREEEDGEDHPCDKMSAQATINKALEADNLNFADFKFDFDFDDDIIQIAKTIDRNQNDYKFDNKENNSNATKTLSLSRNSSGDEKSDDSHDQYKSCTSSVDITTNFDEENTLVATENDSTVHIASQKKDPIEITFVSENDEDFFSSSILNISNSSAMPVRNSRRKGKHFDPIELSSMSFNNIANSTQVESANFTGAIFSTPQSKEQSKVQKDSMVSNLGLQSVAAKRPKRQQMQIRSLSQTTDQTFQFDQTSSIMNTTSDRVLRPRNNRVSYKDLHNGTPSKKARR